jgi:hypothetical protein
MREHLARLFVDTAATMPTALGPAMAMTGLDHIVYGSDCGVPCSTEATMDANIVALRERAGLSPDQVQFIGRNALNLFPKTAARMQLKQRPEPVVSFPAVPGSSTGSPSHGRRGSKPK